MSWTAASTLVAWPFSGALGIPIAIDAVLLRRNLVTCVKAGLAALVAVLVPLVAIDSYYFGKLVVAPLNLVKYNVLASDTSSELYGTEPWDFYFKNCALNFNVAFPLALAAPILMGLVQIIPGLAAQRPASRLGLLALAPLYLWLAIFVPQPHKEERFLYPVYPIICLAAAVSLERLALVVGALFKSKVRLAQNGAQYISVQSGHQCCSLFWRLIHLHPLLSNPLNQDTFAASDTRDCAFRLSCAFAIKRTRPLSRLPRPFASLR